MHTLPTNIKTIGIAIRVARQAKNLTPGHVAPKMGIAAAMVSDWENGTSLPNDWQTEYLNDLLGFNVHALQAIPPLP